MKRVLVFFLCAAMLLLLPPDAVLAAGPEPPELYAKAAVLMDAATGQVLYGKDEHTRLEPASLTKIMTCLIAVRQGDPEALLTVSGEAVRDMEDSSTMDVTEGETLTLRELLYGLMLPSANDAANVIAEYFSGDNASFARLMNETAASLGLRDTVFVNPHGLPDENHLTTAYDLAALTREALSEPDFLLYTGAAEYDIAKTEQHEAYELEHTHFMLQPDSRYYDERVIAGKTGWTPGAGTCLMTVARQDGTTLIAIVLGADAEDIRYAAYGDVKKLLDYGFGHFTRGDVSVSAVSYYPVSFRDGDGTMRRGSLSGEGAAFSPLIPEGCSGENIFLRMPEEQQLQEREQVSLTAAVTFRDEDGKVWPWPLAEIPLTLELQALSGQTVSREEEARPAMAAAGEDHTLVWAALLCVLLLGILALLWFRLRPGKR